MRHQYIIGDLQGCYGAFTRLLSHIEFDETQDKLYLCGDIVARGEDSLATLRAVKALADKGALETVLGNHDITLIATWLGVLAPKPKDGTLPIFSAPDGYELLDWLRRQPFLIMPNKDSVVVHAGIPPHWQTKDAKRYAQALSAQFSGSLWQLRRILPHLYDKQPRVWHADGVGVERLAMISDYFTRMRLCQADGTLELKFKAGIDDAMPEGFLPWWQWQADRRERIYFGHWAALEAKIDTQAVRALDGGAVWGGKLVAYRLGDGAVFSV